MESPMSFSLPELPYSPDALAPYMSRETVELHHDKHHLAYAAKMLDAAMNKMSHAA
jgi:superoxide dismutase